MNHREWHDQEIARNPDYARASAEIALAQTIADLVVDARIRAGLTQAELAKLAGTTQARISVLESGDGNPTLGTMAGVLAVLGDRVDLDLAPIGAAILGASVAFRTTAVVSGSPSIISGSAAAGSFTTEVPGDFATGVVPGQGSTSTVVPGNVMPAGWSPAGIASAANSNLAQAA